MAVEDFKVAESVGGLGAASDEEDLGDVFAVEDFGTATAKCGCGDASTGEDFGGATVEEGCGDASHEEVCCLGFQLGLPARDSCLGFQLGLLKKSQRALLGLITIV